MRVHAFLGFLVPFWVTVPGLVSVPEAAAKLGLVSLIGCGYGELLCRCMLVVVPRSNKLIPCQGIAASVRQWREPQGRLLCQVGVVEVPDAGIHPLADAVVCRGEVGVCGVPDVFWVPVVTQLAQEGQSVVVPISHLVQDVVIELDEAACDVVAGERGGIVIGRLSSCSCWVLLLLFHVGCHVEGSRRFF